MKNKIFTLAFAVAASVQTVFAWDYERIQVGDLYYNLDATNQTAEVTSLAEKPWSDGNYEFTTVTIPSSVTYNDTTFSVTNIGYYAFGYSSNLTSVTIPNSVESIGKAAFAYCSSLTSIVLPNSIDSIGHYAFQSCTGLTSVIIPNNVVSIGFCAFRFCTNLSAITIPNSVTTIESYAFNGCTNLTSITIPNSVTSLGTYAFLDCSGLTSVTIGNSVTSIGDRAFAGCSSLTSINIPNSVTSIGEGVFGECNSLPIIDNIRYADTYLVAAVNKTMSTYTIRQNTRWIGSYAFKDCTNLISVTIPNSVTSIGDYAFRNCTGLTSVTIPNSVTTIGSYAFKDCSGLTSVTIGNSVTQIKSYTFYGCSSLTSINIPNSVTSIEEYAFYNCNSLTSITIGINVTSIGKLAFRGCAKLTTVTIPNSVIDIGKQAFLDCSGLTSVTIGSGIMSIWNAAFRGCSKLTSVTITAVYPPILISAFESCPKLSTIYVPCESFDEYKTADGWNIYAQKMKYKGKRFPIEVTTADSAMGLTIAPDTACYNTSIEILAVPNEGFRFKQWSDGNIDNPRILVAEEGITLIAVFEVIKCSLSLNTNDSTMGRVYGIGEYTFNTQVNCFAIPNVGYEFTSWNDGVLDNPRSIVITKDTTFTAMFKEIEYTLSLLTNDSTMGRVEGTGVYGYEAQVSVKAIPYDGYEFVRWSNNATDNPYVFIIRENTTLMAMFQPVSEGLFDTEYQDSAPHKVLENGQIYILLPDGQRLNIVGVRQ